MSTKILLVDDDPVILMGYQRSLCKQFTLETALGGLAALAMLSEEDPYPVIVADMNMPDMNGIDLLKEVKRRAPATVRLMLTGNDDQSTAVAAVNEGHVFQFLTKPCSPAMLAKALDLAITQHRLLTAERELLEKTLNGSVKVLIDVLSMTDPHSFGFGQKLRDSVHSLAQSMKQDNPWELELAAMLSQIGFVTIPPALLRKHRTACGLSGPEKDMIDRVPEIGAKLLAHIPRLEGAARIVRYQDKHFDGSGFPIDAVAGENIPAGARIIKVLADLARLEGEGVPQFRAMQQLRTRAGWYDPKIIEAASVCFGVDLPDEAAAPKHSRAITLGELRIGHVLAAELESNDGVIIAGATTTISQMLLHKLRNFAELSGIKEPIHIECKAAPSAAERLRRRTPV